MNCTECTWFYTTNTGRRFSHKLYRVPRKSSAQLIIQFEVYVKICHFSVTNIKLLVYVQPEVRFSVWRMFIDIFWCLYSTSTLSCFSPNWLHSMMQGMLSFDSNNHVDDQTVLAIYGARDFTTMFETALSLYHVLIQLDPFHSVIREFYKDQFHSNIFTYLLYFVYSACSTQLIILGLINKSICGFEC
jgi:hypothetical protein